MVRFYLALVLLGFFLPYGAFIPWLVDSPFNRDLNNAENASPE